jgi:hypothetical protein
MLLTHEEMFRFAVSRGDFGEAQTLHGYLGPDDARRCASEVFPGICERGDLDLATWLAGTVPSFDLLPLAAALDAACRGGFIDVAKWLVDTALPRGGPEPEVYTCLLSKPHEWKHKGMWMPIHQMHPYDMNEMNAS